MLVAVGKPLILIIIDKKVDAESEKDKHIEGQDYINHLPFRATMIIFPVKTEPKSDFGRGRSKISNEANCGIHCEKAIDGSKVIV